MKVEVNQLITTMKKEVNQQMRTMQEEVTRLKEDVLHLSHENNQLKNKISGNSGWLNQM